MFVFLVDVNNETLKSICRPNTFSLVLYLDGRVPLAGPQGFVHAVV